jgi:hypothetical protein
MNAAAHYRADPRTTSFEPISSAWRWVFIAVSAVSLAGFFGAVGLWTTAIVSSSDRPDTRLLDAGGIVLLATILFVYVQAFVGMAWMYQAWKWLPWDQRYSRHWKGWISPGQAAAMLLIPYFQYYWMFVVNLGLCDALDRLRVRYPTRDASPKSLALIACIMQMIVPLPVGTICWILLMSKVEAMSREMSAAAVTRGGLAF